MDHKWHDFKTDKPKPEQKGILLKVLYSDGIECKASWAGGCVWFPQGSSTYRYVDVIKWREI